jgi:hypothetical protein
MSPKTFWSRFKCLIVGHDDFVRRAPNRMYLECAECGRATKGWDLTREPAVPADGLGPSHWWSDLTASLIAAARSAFNNAVHAFGFR